MPVNHVSVMANSPAAVTPIDAKQATNAFMALLRWSKLVKINNKKN